MLVQALGPGRVAESGWKPGPKGRRVSWTRVTANPHQYYESFAEELTAKFRRVGHLVSHKSATGDYHEEILRTVLRNFLSRRFSVKTGFVYKNELEVSNQVDILIVDEYDASAYIYQEGNFAIVRPQSVVAAIEVKTKLDRRGFEEALNNIASVKRLTDDPEQICGMIFGYEGTPKSMKTLGGWFERVKGLAETPRLGPSLIVLFREAVLLMRLDWLHEVRMDESNNYHPVISALRTDAGDETQPAGWQLRYVLALIYTACHARDVKRHVSLDQSDVQDMLLFAMGVPSANHFQFGVGYVEHAPRV